MRGRDWRSELAFGALIVVSFVIAWGGLFLAFSPLTTLLEATKGGLFQNYARVFAFFFMYGGLLFGPIVVGIGLMIALGWWDGVRRGGWKRVKLARPAKVVAETVEQKKREYEETSGGFLVVAMASFFFGAIAIPLAILGLNVSYEFVVLQRLVAGTVALVAVVLTFFFGAVADGFLRR